MKIKFNVFSKKSKKLCKIYKIKIKNLINSFKLLKIKTKNKYRLIQRFNKLNSKINKFKMKKISKSINNKYNKNKKYKNIIKGQKS